MYINILGFEHVGKNDRRPNKLKTHVLPYLQTPHVTNIFCVICILIYILDAISGYTLTTMGMKENDLILNYNASYRLFTCTLLHASIIHLLSNIIFIRYYGPLCENYYGHLKMLIVIIASAFSGSLCSLAFTDERSVGASGIAFGLVGALLAVRYVMPADYKKKIVRSCIYVIVINLVLGLLNPAIDNAAHIGGFIGGLTIGWCLAARMETEHKLDRRLGAILYLIFNIGCAICAYSGLNLSIPSITDIFTFVISH